MTLFIFYDLFCVIIAREIVRLQVSIIYSSNNTLPIHPKHQISLKICVVIYLLI